MPMAYVPPNVKPGDRVKVTIRKCGCVRFRVNGIPRRRGLDCAKHGGR
jgi:hypothetical protein